MERRSLTPVAAGLGVAVALAVAIAVALGLGRGGQPLASIPSASPPATATATGTPTRTPATTPTPTAVATSRATATDGTGTISGPCENMSFQAGDTPIVPPKRSGRYLQLTLAAVRPASDGGNRWLVRFFLPRSAPANAVIALDATVSGPQGPLAVREYAAGPPNSETVPVTEPVTLQPCDPAAPTQRGHILIAAHTGPVSSGTYTLTWRGIRLPEGTTSAEVWTVTLTCTIEPGPQRATSCR